jgi:DNA-binding IclR family transcriptional regulator
MPGVEPVYPTKAAVLVAVGNGARSLTEVALAVNIGRSSAYHWLKMLRDEGWIIWPPGTEGTLRPNFGIVADWRNR